MIGAGEGEGVWVRYMDERRGLKWVINSEERRERENMFNGMSLKTDFNSIVVIIIIIIMYIITFKMIIVAYIKHYIPLNLKQHALAMPIKIF